MALRAEAERIGYLGDRAFSLGQAARRLLDHQRIGVEARRDAAAGAELLEEPRARQPRGDRDRIHPGLLADGPAHQFDRPPDAQIDRTGPGGQRPDHALRRAETTRENQIHQSAERLLQRAGVRRHAGKIRRPVPVPAHRPHQRIARRPRFRVERHQDIARDARRHSIGGKNRRRPDPAGLRRHDEKRRAGFLPQRVPGIRRPGIDQQRPVAVELDRFPADAKTHGRALDPHDHPELRKGSRWLGMDRAKQRGPRETALEIVSHTRHADGRPPPCDAPGARCHPSPLAKR